MEKTDWLEAPTVSGLYWAYRDKGKQKPSICRVNVFSVDRWSATFISGTQSYTFRLGQGWRWMPAETPEPPGRKRVVA